MKRRGLKFLALSISAALLVGTLAACGSKKDSASKSSGDNSFVITLYPDVAPITCENFEKLVKDGFYDGLKFHRVVEDFMAQGGDPKGDGTGGSTDTIKGEFSQNGVENTLSHTHGVVSMARSNDPDSASSQFFICYGDESFLDGQYAAFGKVTEGMDVVDSFVKVERSMGSDGAVSSPNTDIIMENVKMIDDDSDGNPRVEITMNDFLK
ncbi:peptidylprolyl isomerase [Ruminococcus sp.]|uniref:peptidylprolyl isomerase n=1 Tax=Ruminococcus sp. TaxID=41978 RepID=UPI0035217BD0